MRITRIVAVAAVAIMAVTGLWLFVFAPLLAERSADRIGYGDYTLNATDGTTFTDDSLEGEVTAVFFGFTHCPDVCPTTLGDMMGWQDRLGADAEDLRIVFVTVDPERDSLDLLRDYVGWLPGAIGVTGSVEEVKAAEAAFRAFSQKEALEDGGYTVAHTSKVLLFGPDGEFAETIDYQEDPASAVKKIRDLLPA